MGDSKSWDIEILATERRRCRRGVQEVLLLDAIGDLPVVERDARRRRPVLAQDHNPVSRGEVGEALSHRDRLQHRHRALELVPPGRLHRADHGHLAAVHFANDDRHFGSRNEIRQPRNQLLAEIARRETGGLKVIEERNRDLPVRPHRNDATQFGVLPHGNVQHVFRPDLVGGGLVERISWTHGSGRARRLEGRAR